MNAETIVEAINILSESQRVSYKEGMMAYEERGINRSRVVVETPSARREVNRTEREYVASPNGVSSATVAAVVVLAIAVVGLLALLFWTMQTNQNNANLAAQQPTPKTIAQQPAQQAPVIVQQPA